MTNHVSPHPPAPGDYHWYSDDTLDHGPHPKHPPFLVDRCADECDDQLPLFSQVGRGLEGEGYRVVVSKDSDDGTETELSGYYRDPHTGEMVYDWTSENINGGRLYYSYHIRNFTDPQTFTITFRYVRPNRDADEEGTVWSWTSPAIPYVGDEDMGDLIASWVSTLYLRKKGENWNWRQHEKLVYPEGMTHQSVNAPGPEEGWTVNLTYGIDRSCDIVVPTVEDLAKIIGMKPDWIYNIVNEAVPTDVIPNGMNVKEYIDSLNYSVVSDTPDYLSVTKDTAEKKWRLASLFEAGAGILFKKKNGKMQIVNNIAAGPGIAISGGNDGNPLVIANSQIAGRWKRLTPGKDFLWRTHNGWYFGACPLWRVDESQQTRAFTNTYPSTWTYTDDNGRTYTEDGNPPGIWVIINRAPNGSITSAEIDVANYAQQRISATTDDGVWHPELNGGLYNLRNLIGSRYYDYWKRWDVERLHRKVRDENPDRSDGKWECPVMQFAHSEPLYNAPGSSVVSFKFVGDYAELNNLSIVSGSAQSAGVANISGRINDNGDVTQDVAWRDIGARWHYPSYVQNLAKNSVYAEFPELFKALENPTYYQFVIGWGGTIDGHNGNLRSPGYTISDTPVSTIGTNSWVNYDVRFTLM